MAHVMFTATRNFLRTWSATLLEEHLQRRKQFEIQLNIQNSEKTALDSIQVGNNYL